MSSFHHLPHFILSSVAQYIHDPNNIWLSMCPLLWLCRSWRYAALNQLQQTYYLDYVHKKYVMPISPEPSKVKTLYVYVECQYFCGPLPCFYQFHQNAKMIFTNAKALIVDLNLKPWKNCGLQNTIDESNIRDYVNNLDSLAPNISNVAVNCSFSRYHQIHNNSEVVVRNLLSTIYVSGTRKLLKLSNGYALERLFVSGLNAINGITHLVICEYIPHRNGKFVQRFAKTLQFITIYTPYRYSDFSNMFTIPNSKECVVYPCLELFRLTVLYPPNISDIASSHPDAIPFPNLQTFICSGIYPFKDDVVFRGNEHSLKFVDTDVCTNGLQKLMEFPLLTTALYTNLTCVVLRCPLVTAQVKDSYLSKVTQSDIMQVFQANSCSNHLQPRRSATKAYQVNPGILIRFVGQPYLHLHSLNFDNCVLTFEGTIKLIKSFPQLIVLKFRGMVFESTPPPLKNLQSMVKEDRSLSKELKEIHIYNLYDGMIANVVRSMASIAILCPNLELLLLDYFELSENVQDEWDILLKQDGFKSHAKWLESVIDIRS